MIEGVETNDQAETLHELAHAKMELVYTSLGPTYLVARH